MHEESPNKQQEAETSLENQNTNKIPIRNIWLLMLYANDLKIDNNDKKVEIEDMPKEIIDLVAKLLCQHVQKRIQANLSVFYQPREKTSDRVRGRIDILKTEQKQLMRRGKINCRFDELNNNTLRNRYVKAALEKLSRLKSKKINVDLQKKCRVLAETLRRLGVVGDCPARNKITQINQFGMHDKDDQKMLAAAHLVFNLAIPTEITGNNLFSIPIYNDVWFRTLFEKAIAGFYKLHLRAKGWKVNSQVELKWQNNGQAIKKQQSFPNMKADIVLTHEEKKQKIIIDTKFTNIISQGQFNNELFSPT